MGTEMKKAKIIYKMGEQVFQLDNYSSKYDLFERYTIDTFLKTIPDTAKSSILELMEYYFINTIVYFARHEIRDMMPYLTENESNYDIDSPEPTYISEYIGIVGNLFLAGYIDFLCDWDDDYKQTDYPTNLSYYGNSKYEAWVYFRDNFFYKKLRRR